ncbi:unnamed protein product, partial [Allacma fusca]
MISNEAGFLWLNDGLYDLTSRRYNASTENLKNIKVLDAWEEIKRAINAGYPQESRKKLLQHSSILANGLEEIPRKSSFWSGNFSEDARNYVQTIGKPVPSEKHPVNKTIDKFELQLFYTLTVTTLKPEDVIVHPAGLIFPGDVQTRSSK